MATTPAWLEPGRAHQGHRRQRRRPPDHLVCAAAPGNLKNNSMFLHWGKAGGKEALEVTHQGTGKPWLTLCSRWQRWTEGAVRSLILHQKTVTPVEQANKSLPQASTPVAMCV